MRGRKPKPTHLKVIAGNPGKRPLNRHEPKPRLEVPTCPSHLCPAAKAEWKRLARQLLDLGVVSTLDRAVMAAYCQAYGRWVEAERRQKDAPLVIRLPSGVIQQSPFVSIANKQLELMHKFLAELGLSPSSRSRVSARPGAIGHETEDARAWREYRETYG
jgi:P27 family predicted phage terminase small subunit